LKHYGEKIGSSMNMHSFKRTPRFASYLYGLVAGPYTFIEEIKPNMVPMRLYMRKSIASEVQPKLIQQIFMGVSEGMHFFEDLFGVKYPFSKYDQIYLPEYNNGGMENVAMVTMAES
jgi:aminopeptidase N